MSEQTQSNTHFPATSQIAQLLNSQGFVVGYWELPESGKSSNSCMVGRTAPVAGEMIGVDGRTYTGIVHCEPFEFDRHPDLATIAAYGVRRTWDYEKRDLCSWLSNERDCPLFSVVAILHPLSQGVVRTLSEHANLRPALLDRDVMTGIAQRQAELAYEGYDFGELTVEGADGWEFSTPVGGDWSRKVYVREHDEEGSTSKISFTVRFNADLAVVEAYSLNSSGSPVGKAA